MMSVIKQRRARQWTWLRHAVQVAILLCFVSPLLVSGWGLFGVHAVSDNAVPTPSELPFFGSLSSSSIAGISLLDPFAALQVVAASKTFAFDWLLFTLPVIVFYGIIRGRAFCGWVCPVNLLLEGVDILRKKLNITVKESPIPRHIKLWVALGVLVFSAIASVPLFEALSPISAVNKGILFGSTAGTVTLLSIIAVELFWGHRVWCRALCPLGGFYQAIGRIGIVKVKHDRAACIHCDACTNACLADPVILHPVLTERDSVVRAGDCMICGSCIDACPTQALTLGIMKPGGTHQDRYITSNK